jgi:hypothetical protein
MLASLVSALALVGCKKEQAAAPAAPAAETPGAAPSPGAPGAAAPSPAGETAPGATGSGTTGTGATGTGAGAEGTTAGGSASAGRDGGALAADRRGAEGASGPGGTAAGAGAPGGAAAGGGAGDAEALVGGCTQIIRKMVACANDPGFKKYQARWTAKGAPAAGQKNFSKRILTWRKEEGARAECERWSKREAAAAHLGAGSKVVESLKDTKLSCTIFGQELDDDGWVPTALAAE